MYTKVKRTSNQFYYFSVINTFMPVSNETSKRPMEIEVIKAEQPIDVNNKTNFP